MIITMKITYLSTAYLTVQVTIVGGCEGDLALKLSSPLTKFEFNVFSIIHLMTITFDVLDQIQENKMFQTGRTINNILRSNTKCSFVTMETVTF